MSTKYKQPGKILTLTAPANVAADAVVQVGQIVGMAVHSASSGDPVEVAVEGVYEFPVLATDVVAEGDLLYWDGGNSRLTTTATGSLLVGYAVGGSANGVATVDIRLSGQARADEA